MKKIMLIGSLLLVMAVMLAACNLPSAQKTPTTAPDLVNTAAAMTVQALTTQIGQVTTPTPGESATAQATQSTIPTATNTPSGPTPTTVPCDRGSFVKDVTIPDGTVMSPGASFTKTWELKNTGTCTWNSNYAIVFANKGNILGGPASKQLTSGTVAPGESVQVSVDMKAPTTPGSYRSEWQLRNASGVVFGIGPGANQTFYVDIKVNVPEYSFIDHYCDAKWTSGSGSLDCPGTDGDVKGFVIKVNDPKLENGTTENEAALWTNPQAVENGEISGKFPAVKIAQGSHFKTVIGCLNGASNCNVVFSLKYKQDGGDVKTLKEWTQTYDGTITKIDLDLSDLAGSSVEFILTVRANGEMNQDKAFWLMPRIGS